MIQTLKTDTFSMNYIKFGTGSKTFVILPGLSVQSVMGAEAAIASQYYLFADDYTVYVFDRRSDIPDSYNVYDMAEDTAAAFIALGLREIHLFGASQGGMMAMVIAARHPELISKLVLGSTAARIGRAWGNVPEEPQIDLRGEMQGEGRREVPKEVPGKERGDVIRIWTEYAKEGNAYELYRSFGEKCYPKAVYEQSRDLLASMAETVTAGDLDRFVILAEGTEGFDITGELPKITCPVLVIGDTTDCVLGVEATKEIADLLKDKTGFELYLYEGFGHAAYDTAPDYAGRILDFFQTKP